VRGLGGGLNGAGRRRHGDEVILVLGSCELASDIPILAISIGVISSAVLPAVVKDGGCQCACVLFSISQKLDL
jgi:hypothetical protein